MSQVNVEQKIKKYDLVVAERIGGVVVGLKDMSGNNISLPGADSPLTFDPGAGKLLYNSNPDVDTIYVIRDIGGNVIGFEDKDGGALVNYEFTWANFLLEVPTEYPAGTCVQITDRHSNSAGTGQVRFKAGSTWKLDSECIYYSTFAAAWAELSNAAWVDTKIRCGDVAAGRILLRHIGTRFIPDNGTGVLFGATFGSIASPTKTLTSAVKFDLGNPKIPGGLIAAGDRLRFNGRWHKNGAGGTSFFRACIGTANDFSNGADAIIWETSVANINNTHVNAEALVFIGTSTSLNSNRALVLAGSGSAPGAYETSGNFNVASDMYLSIGVGDRTSPDILALLGYSLIWEV